MTRLLAAETPEMAQTLAFAARNAIGEAIDDVTRREGLDPRRLGRVTVVGNSAMLALLAARNHGLLLQPAYWTAPVDCAASDSPRWAAAWNIAASAEIELVPLLGGFCRSDLIAGLVASVHRWPVPGPVHRLRHQFRNCTVDGRDAVGHGNRRRAGLRKRRRQLRRTGRSRRGFPRQRGHRWPARLPHPR